jgi:hypothetical protein
MAITRSPVSASLAQFAVLDHEDKGPIALVADRERVPAAPLLEQNVGAASHHRRHEAIGADVAIGFRAGLDRAKAVGARSEGELKDLGRLRGDLSLKLDVPHRALAEHAHLAVR